MGHNKRYTLDDFKKDAQRRFPDQFTAVADVGAYRFEKISYVSGDKEGSQAEMLSIGHYYQKNGGPTVWAYANGHRIRYYFGKHHEVCALVPDGHLTRIYYHEPFKFMGSQQGCADPSRGMNAARQYEKAVFETVVHFIFLLTGRFALVFNPAGMDMLGNLKFACMSLASNLKAKDDTKRALSESLRAMEAESESSSEDYMDAVRNAVAPVKHSSSSSPAAMNPNKRARMDSHDAPAGHEPPQRTKRSFLLLPNTSPLSTPKLAREKQAHEQDVQELKAELAAQEVKYKATKAKYKEEKAKRQAAEAQSSEWETKYAELQEALPTPREELEAVKEERADSEEPAFIEEKQVGTKRSRVRRRKSASREEESEQEMKTNIVHDSVENQRLDFEKFWGTTQSIITADAAKDRELNKVPRMKAMKTLNQEYQRRHKLWEDRKGRKPPKRLRKHMHAEAVEVVKQKLAQEKIATAIKAED